MIIDIKSARLSAGLSQIQLAHESGVSLPTIQNIEAQKANITMQVLEKLVSTLGLEVRVQFSRFNVEQAIMLGVPLASTASKNYFKPTAQSLIIEARRWIMPLQKKIVSEREELALVAFLMAIKDHYSSFYRKFLNAPVFEEKIKEYRKDGRVIKLRRISLSKLSEYL